MADDIADLHLQLFVCLELVSCHCTWLCWMLTLRSYASGPHFPSWCCYGSPRSRQPYVGTQVGVGHFQLEVLESVKGCRQQGEHNNIMSIHEAWTYDDLCSFLLFFHLPNPEASGARRGVWSIKPLVCWEMWWFSPPHRFSKHRGVRWSMSASLISAPDGPIWLATRPLNFWSSILSMQSWCQMPLVFIPCYSGSLPFCCFLGVWV